MYLERRSTVSYMENTTRLWRPTGAAELALVRAAECRRWPPRLSGQPIFYPVLTEDYAAQIAREWNTRGGAIGYVTQFSVDTDYLRRYDVHIVGGRQHAELWVPATELDQFNDHLRGYILVSAAYAAVVQTPASLTWQSRRNFFLGDTYYWMYIDEFCVPESMTFDHAIVAAIGSPKFRDSHAAMYPASITEHDVHGPYLASAVTASNYVVSSASESLRECEEFVLKLSDDAGSGPLLPDPIRDVFASASSCRKLTLPDTDRHEWGWVVVDFQEYAVWDASGHRLRMVGIGLD
jgi:hypothetical protein